LAIVSVLSSEQLFVSRRNDEPNGSGDPGDGVGGVGDVAQQRRAKFESIHGDLLTYAEVFRQYKHLKGDEQKRVRVK
jgi:hypothetical protein